SWKDVFASVAPAASVSYAASRRGERFGVFTLDNDERWTQAFAQTAWTPRDGLALRGGGDLDARRSRFVGSVPDSRADRGPGARFTKFDDMVNGGRAGA